MFDMQYLLAIRVLCTSLSSRIHAGAYIETQKGQRARLSGGANIDKNEGEGEGPSVRLCTHDICMYIRICASFLLCQLRSIYCFIKRAQKSHISS